MIYLSIYVSWWRHQTETFSALLAIWAGNSPVSSPHQGQCRGAVMFSLICVWINGWVNNREAGDLRHYRSHYDVSVMSYGFSERVCLNFLRGCAKGTCRPGDRFENCYHGDLSNSSHCKQFDDGMPINQKYWIYGYWSFQWINGDHSWWRHQMETFSALLAICAGNSPAPVNSPHKGQGRGALMFSLICVSINGWVSSREAGDSRRYCAHFDVNVMSSSFGNAHHGEMQTAGLKVRNLLVVGTF